MKLINQFAKISLITPHPEATIEHAARTCYKTEATTEARRTRLIQRLVKSKHGAMLEFADATFQIVTNRGVTHELVRHRLCSFAQESTRYCDYKGHLEFIRPVWLNMLTGTYMNQEVLESLLLRTYQYKNIPKKTRDSNIADIKFLLNCMHAEEEYKGLRILGWPPEKAREVLPNSLATTIMVKANLREWLHMCSLRTSAKAHPQIRELFQSIYLTLSAHAPILFPLGGTKR